MLTGVSCFLINYGKYSITMELLNGKIIKIEDETKSNVTKIEQPEWIEKKFMQIRSKIQNKPSISDPIIIFFKEKFIKKYYKSKLY